MSKDVYVYSAVPPRSKTSIKKYGLLSGARVIGSDSLLKKARPKKEDRDKFVKMVKEKLSKRSLSDKVSVLGPSVFFTELDESKITEDHFIKRWSLEKIRINLTELLRDEPETIIYGAELIPIPIESDEMSEVEFGKYLESKGFKGLKDFRAARRRPLTLAEVRAYTKRSPRAMWRHYSVEHHTGRYYAANVPHAFIITPTGQIPAKYIDFV